MAFQMKAPDRGFYNLTPMFPSESHIWNKERTPERVRTIAVASRPTTAPLWFQNPGTGNTHAQQYAHFRAPNDVYSDAVYNRPSTRFAPPKFNSPQNQAAGKPGEKDAFRFIVPSSETSPASICRNDFYKNTRFPGLSMLTDGRSQNERLQRKGPTPEFIRKGPLV